jgi:diacylglycerol kinase family enzyme
VANGILLSGSSAELGILPSGTGGDFRRTLRIPSRTADAAKILRNGRTRQIDVGSVTFSNRTGELDTRYFLGVASFGLSANVIARVKESDGSAPAVKLPKWLSGRLSFGLAMAETAVKNKPSRIAVQLDDDAERHMTIANLCIANARYFGGGMKIAPNAKLDDGVFDVISIGDIGAARILANAPRLYLGAHLSIPEVGHALAGKVSARPVNIEDRIEIEVDGELPGYLPATFEILPKALRVRCP